MFNLIRDCERLILSDEQVISGFNCGNADLNKFINLEKEAYQQEPDETLQTRYMFFDMILWRNRMNS